MGWSRNYGQESRTGRASRMTSSDADEILADPSHPIWKIMFALVAVLGSAWGIQNGGIV